MKKRDYEKRQKRITRVAGLFALIVIPVYSILFGLNAPLFEYNFSLIGGTMGKQDSLILWGTITGFFYLFFVHFMYRLVGIHNKRAIRLVTIGCILLLLTVLVPFCPDVLPITAEIHNFTAFTGTVLMVATVYYFVYALGKLDKTIYKKGMIALNIVVGISVILYFFRGITSAVEIILVVGNLAVLIFMFLSLQRSDRIDTLKELEKLEENTEQRILRLVGKNNNPQEASQTQTLREEAEPQTTAEAQSPAEPQSQAEPQKAAEPSENKATTSHVASPSTEPKRRKS